MIGFDPDRAIARLAERLGVAELAFDQNGHCVLATEDFEVHLDSVPDTDSLFVYAKIGELPEDPPAELYRLLLEANFFTRETAGCTIGSDEFTGVILLFARWTVLELDDDNFEPRLFDFFEAVDLWIGRIGALLDAEAPTPTETAVQSTRVLPDPAVGMIRG